MKRTPYTWAEPTGESEPHWRSLGERGDSESFREALEREFPESATLEWTGEIPVGAALARRSFLKLASASVGFSGLVACRRPEQKIVPYARAPESALPGSPIYFATAMPFDGNAIGLLVESHQGRPTKIEGHPQHPESLGATSTYAQAAVLDLYDPLRGRRPRLRGAGRAIPVRDSTTVPAVPRRDSELQGRDDCSLQQIADELTRVVALHQATSGLGFAVLTEAHRSPSLARLLYGLQTLLPKALIVRYEPLARESERHGSYSAFGRSLEVHRDLTNIRCVVALDADLFGAEPSSVRLAREVQDARRPERGEPARLWSIESRLSITGASADERVMLRSADVHRFLCSITRALVIASTRIPAPIAEAAQGVAPLNADLEKRAAQIADDILSSEGHFALIAGRLQEPRVHALALALESALGSRHRSLVARNDSLPSERAANGQEQIELGSKASGGSPSSGAQDLVSLAANMRAGQVQHLVILGGNPAYDAPSEAGFSEALAHVEWSLHLSHYENETSRLTLGYVPRSHFLECWGDVRAADGTTSVVQPLIAPLHSSWSEIDLVLALLGRRSSGHEAVRDTWRTMLPALDFEQRFARILHDGYLTTSRTAPLNATLDAIAVAKSMATTPIEDGLEITFSPDSHTFDGRFATNGWLQELPDPMTKLTWANAALVSPARARSMNIEDGDVLEITANGTTIAIPAIIAPGQHQDSVALTLGQGREGFGTNTYPLRTSFSGFAVGATITKRGDRVGPAALARTQEHFLMEGRELARRGTLGEFRKQSDFAKHRVQHRTLLPLYQEARPEGHAWGMSIDLGACNGCSACVVACQAENNIPVVGPEGVARSREMHWLRIDRYFAGDPNNPTSISQPLLCQHCEAAPCEQVCPVGATTHSPEGINEMTYNRCIGTKYCGNNCPYKVRRFNWFDLRKDQPTLIDMVMNPDVTVRSRGVMEKCTFCVQRVNAGKLEAKKDGRSRVEDGAVVTACQSACPTRAITFGDLEDPGSAVRQASESPRAYRILEEINVRPRVSYLARVDNPKEEPTS